MRKQGGHPPTVTSTSRYRQSALPVPSGDAYWGATSQVWRDVSRLPSSRAEPHTVRHRGNSMTKSTYLPTYGFRRPRARASHRQAVAPTWRPWRSPRRLCAGLFLGPDERGADPLQIAVPASFPQRHGPTPHSRPEPSCTPSWSWNGTLRVPMGTPWRTSGSACPGNQPDGEAARRLNTWKA